MEKVTFQSLGEDSLLLWNVKTPYPPKLHIPVGTHSFLLFSPLSTPSSTRCLFLLPHEEGEQGARKRLTKSHSCFLSNSVLLDLVIIFIPTQLQQKDNFLSLFFINKCFRREIEDVSKLSNTTQGLVPSDFCALQTHTNAAVCLSLNVSRSKGAVGKRKIKQDLKRDVKASLCHILQISSLNLIIFSFLEF